MDHFTYKNNAYYAENVPLETLAHEVSTPFYCYSNATIQRHYHVFFVNFPKALVCYAMKANGNRAILKSLANLGAGVDVVSEGEIRLALASGIAANKIVFSGVGKTKDEMRYALEQGIFQFNCESQPELQALNEVAASMGVKAPVALRVNPDVDPKTHAKISTGQKESKFGIAMVQALDAYRLAESLPAIKVQGVSVHIGSQLTSLEPFAQAFRRVRSFVDELRAEGITIQTVDLGGGLGIPYEAGATPPDPQAYAETVKQEMGDINAQLIFEPGRMMMGNAGILVTKVMYVKDTGSRKFVIVDAAMNDLMRPTLYDAYHDIVPVQKLSAPEEPVDIVGPVCETGDIFAEQRMMPLPKAGDLLAIRSAGAYGSAMANNYNARLLVPELLVNGDKHAVIRKRQEYSELIDRDVIPDWL